MTYAEDIRRIAKEDLLKDGLGEIAERTAIPATITAPKVAPTGNSALHGPLTLEILTYDDTADVVIQADNGTFTIKTVKTAKLTDGDGNEYEITEITYPDPNA